MGCSYKSSNGAIYNIKRIGYNGITCRKVGINGSVIYLQSYWEATCSKFPYTYTVYTERTVPEGKANHTFSQYTYGITEVYDGSQQPLQNGLSTACEASFYYYVNGNQSTMAAFSGLTYGMTYQNGVYSSTYNGGRLKSTLTLRVVNGGVSQYTTQKSYTDSQGVNGGTNNTKFDFFFATSVKPNNGNISPISAYTDFFNDSVVGKTTTRYGYNEIPQSFTWNTW